MRRGFLLLALSIVLLAPQNRDLRLEPSQPANLLGDKGTRWAVVIGISSYDNLPPAAQLRFAHRDAEEFAAFLRSVEGGGLPSGIIRVLANEGATLAAIRAPHCIHGW